MPAFTYTYTFTTHAHAGTLEDGRVICFDAKIGFDDNAEFRQQRIFDMHDPSEYAI